MKKVLLLLCALYTPVAFSHGMVHEQIHELSHQIKHHPKNDELYLKRGRLYIEDEHYSEAQQDFNKALQLNPKNRSAHYHLGRVALLEKNTILQLNMHKTLSTH